MRGSGTSAARSRALDVRLLSRSGWRATLLFALAVIIVPTLAYAFVADRMGFLGPRINADLFVVYIAAVLVARRRPGLAALLSLVGVVGALAVQVLLGVGVIYLDDPALIREYLSFAAFWPWRLITFWLVVAAAMFTIMFLLLRRIPMKDAAIVPIAAVLVLLLALDLAGRTAAGHALVGGNLVTSSAVRGYKLARTWATTEGFTVKPIAEPMMVEDVLSEPLPPRILSLSVEALGLARDERFNRLMFAPMREVLAGRYHVEIGRHGFKGATLSGEMRELCGQRTAGTPTTEKALALRSGCLPGILAARGYDTLGIHGNSKFFYNRSEVYPALGFTATRFIEDFDRADPRPARCKTRAFEGICDRDAIAAALDFLAGRPRGYAHVMTLDTHFPLGPTELGDADCGAAGHGYTDADLCLYFNQMSNLLAMIGREVRGARTPPDRVYLFGDHAPPYAVASERNFFNRKEVPFITLRRVSSPPAAASS